TLLTAVKVREDPGFAVPSDKWRLDIGQLKVENFGPYYSFFSYYKVLFFKYFYWRKQADNLIKEHDVILLRTPSPNISLITKSAIRFGKPLILIFPGNMEKCSTRIIGNRGLKRVFYLALNKLLIRQEQNCARNSKLIYVYSSELFERFKDNNSRVRKTLSPQVCLKDFVYREDTCQSPEIRLLRVGWITPTKGLEYLFEALALLLSKGIKVRIEIAGKEGQSIGYKLRLEKVLENLKIKDKVDFIGWIPYDQIHEIYLRNDIQVISSVSEGIPRCIAEGAARGLPLVSTMAGGSSDLLTHERNSLLVPSKDSKSLALAIERLIKDDKLRKNLIRGGYCLARSVSFENLGEQLISEIQNVVCTK
ncbi:MAG: glycosyltransferase, partial [Nitrospinales bacterium]